MVRQQKYIYGEIIGLCVLYSLLPYCFFPSFLQILIIYVFVVVCICTSIFKKAQKQGGNLNYQCFTFIHVCVRPFINLYDDQTRPICVHEKDSSLIDILRIRIPCILREEHIFTE